jgi:hypothetical protein
MPGVSGFDMKQGRKCSPPAVLCNFGIFHSLQNHNSVSKANCQPVFELRTLCATAIMWNLLTLRFLQFVHAIGARCLG